MKKFTSLILALILCISISTSSINVFASEISTTEEKPYSVITVSDENGKDVQYEVYDDCVTDIPLYAAKEGDTSRALTQVATLRISVGNKIATFAFMPSNVGIALLTLGFTGDFKTYSSGIRYGYNPYSFVLSGAVSAPQKGTGSLSGTYTVIGYQTSSILESFAW